MGTITSSVGLISGIDTGTIINELISLDSGPVKLLQTKNTSDQNLQTTYTSLKTSLSSIKSIADNLTLPTTFANATANSSNQNVLTATTSAGAAVGSYQFTVGQLVTTQQSISDGFSDTNSAPVGAGTITLERGGGQASSQTALNSLNGGAGVSRGQFRITDRSGASTIIDDSSSVTLDDVVNQINNATGISVTAKLTNNGIVLTDLTGKGTSALTVQNLSGSSAASSLGIAGSAAGRTLTGSNINYLTASSQLAQINDGNGIAVAGVNKPDFKVTAADGSSFSVSLYGAKSIGDVLTAINSAAGNKVTAAINSSGNGISLTDKSGGGGTLSVAAQNGSSALSQLGLNQTASGNKITGGPVLAGLDSVLVRSLNGGQGFNLGQISLTDRAGNAAQVDLSGATSVSDILDGINNAGIGVQASLNNSGNGIQLTDTSGGSGNLVIGEVAGGTTAADLGIGGTFTPSTTNVVGTNLQRQYVSGNTLLSNYNGGAGVNLGQFQVTSSKGASTTIDLSTGNFSTLGDVIGAINGANIGVTASINSKGNGLLLTDTAGGPQSLSVKNLNGTTAASNLNIAGTAATGSSIIDGAEQKTITVTATDTLATLQTKINSLSFGVTAQIVNDGSSTNPYRLSLTSINSGKAGQVLIDSGSTNLNARTIVTAQDAAVFYGGSGGSQPLLITSSKNQLTNVIKGVTVNLVSASSSPVTLSIAPDSTNIASQLSSFVTNFNSVKSTIAGDSTYNTTTNSGGILLGDATAQSIVTTLDNLITTRITGAGNYKNLSDIGITIDTTVDPSKGAQLTFNQSTFDTAYANDPAGVQALFTQVTSGLGSVISKSVNTLVDPVSGLITNQYNTLDTEIRHNTDSINSLNAILAQKKTQLQNEFANLETTLAGLQSQSAALASLTGGSTSTSTSSSKSSSSSSS